MKQLTLTEYAGKYKISLSLLEYKIKMNQVEYLFSKGSYFLPDRPLYEISPFSGHPSEKTFSDNLEDQVQKLKEILNQKEKELSQIKTAYEDLKNLNRWLEADNKNLKKFVSDFERLENFLKEKDLKEPPSV